MRKNVYAIAAAAALMVGSAGVAEAQVCAGQPTAAGQWAIGGRAAWPSEPSGLLLGAEGSYNIPGPLGFFASLNLVTPDDDNAPSQNLLGAGVAFEADQYLPVPGWLSVCPIAAVSIGTSDGTTNFTVPVGVGLGTTFSVAPGMDIMPYAIPQFVLTRVSATNVDVATDTNFGIEVGAMAGVGPVYVGVGFNRRFNQDAELDIPLVRAGVRLPF
jgi:hypothetical protein